MHFIAPVHPLPSFLNLRLTNGESPCRPPMHTHCNLGGHSRSEHKSHGTTCAHIKCLMSLASLSSNVACRPTYFPALSKASNDNVLILQRTTAHAPVRQITTSIIIPPTNRSKKYVMTTSRIHVTPPHQYSCGHRDLFKQFA